MVLFIRCLYQFVQLVQLLSNVVVLFETFYNCFRQTREGFGLQCILSHDAFVFYALLNV